MDMMILSCSIKTRDLSKTFLKTNIGNIVGEYGRRKWECRITH